MTALLRALWSGVVGVFTAYAGRPIPGSLTVNRILRRWGL